jgi:hypothetical protein
MKTEFHVITRCTRPQNLLQIYDSFNYIENDTYSINWHVLFDVSSLIDIDSKLLLDLSKLDANLHFVESDGTDYLYPQISNVVSNINSGWIVIMDDDNICYPNYFDVINREIRSNFKSAYVYEQEVNGRDFTGLDIRKVGPEHMKLKHIDSAQYIIHSSLHKRLKYEPGYDADGKFIEKLYAEHSDEFGFIGKPLCYYNALAVESKPKVPKVLYVGPDKPELKSIKYADYEEDSLNVKYIENDKKYISCF